MLQKDRDQSGAISAPKTSEDTKLKALAEKAGQISKPDQFKSAEELNIPIGWRNRLIKLLELMEAGKLTHVPDFSRESKRFERPFNMMTWDSTWYCGTVCCIGGSARINQREVLDNRNQFPELVKLFYVGSSSAGSMPPGATGITVEQGATALRGYLETGVANWSHAGF